METTAKLVLFTRQAASGAPAALEGLLREVGLIDRPVTLAGETHYSVGDGLFDLVTFLGCSPSMELEPPTGSDVGPMDFLNVALPAAGPRLRMGRNTLAPACPVCASPRPAWRPEGAYAVCSACGTATDAARLKWRKSAAAGDLFIDLWGIYPAEAVPSPLLLEPLAASTNSPWRHAYLLDEDGPAPQGNAHLIHPG